MSLLLKPKIILNFRFKNTQNFKVGALTLYSVYTVHVYEHLRQLVLSMSDSDLPCFVDYLLVRRSRLID